MGRYTPEPPRRNCFSHLSFDYVEGDRVLDQSPQGDDGDIVGSVDTSPGFIGNGAVFSGDGTYATVTTDQLSVGSRTIAVYFEPHRNPTNNSVHVLGSDDFRIEYSPSPLSVDLVGTDSGSNTTTVTYEADLLDDGAHLIARFDDGDLSLLVDGEKVATGSTTETELNGDTTFELSSSTRFDDAPRSSIVGLADDVRGYSTALSEEHCRALYSIGDEHQANEAFADVWDNGGIPYRGNNERLGGALSESSAHYLRQLDYVLEARHINDASGQQLSRIGEVAGIRRKENEEDPRYRARIKATLAAGRSNGTFSGILEATAAILETSRDRVRIEHEYSTDPATAFVYVRTDDLDDSELTTTDVTNIMSDVVMSGHRINVIERGANSFTVIDDTMVNDPEKGLTSDTISTGGGLVEDV